MSRKRGRAKQQEVQSVPEEILAEGSGPHAHDDAPGEPVIVAMAADDGPEVTPVADADHEGEPSMDEIVLDGSETADVLRADGDAGAETETDASGESASGDGDLEASGESEGVVEVVGDAEAEADVGVTLPTSAASMDPAQLKQLVEALVFASDKPLTVQRLRQLTRVSDVRRLEQTLAELAEDYQGRGLLLQQVSGGYQFRTRSQFSVWVQQLIAGRPVRLSRAQLETLAIIAYRQPITRPEIDDIRGVDSSATLKLLLDRALIRVLGKKEEVGRPMLYGTTKEFLDFFSLGDLRELPTLREYSELSEESRKVMSSRLGVGLDGGGEGGGEGTGGDDGGGDDGGGDGGGGGGSGGGDGGGHGGYGGGHGDPGGSGDGERDRSHDDGNSVTASALSDAMADVLATDATAEIEPVPSALEPMFIDGESTGESVEPVAMESESIGSDIASLAEQAARFDDAPTPADDTGHLAAEAAGIAGIEVVDAATEVEPQELAADRMMAESFAADAAEPSAEPAAE